MRRIRAVIVAVTGAALPVLLYAFPNGPPPAVTGAPGENTCTNCHRPGSGGGKVEIAVPAAAGYVPGVKQEWTVTITDADAQRYGFQLSARLAADNRQAGRLDPAPGESNIIVICANGSPRGTAGCPAAAPVEYIEHSAPRPGNTFRVEWTPPATDQGPVRIYVAANAANGNGESSGDDIYTANSTLTPQAAGGPTFTQAGIVSAASFTPGMSPGSFISIFGQNLAPATRTWDNAVVGTDLPSELEGVRVTIGGKPGFLHLVSPTQINALLPTDEMSGTVDVRVTTPQGAASAGAVVARYAPALFLRPEENRWYIAASDGNGAVVAKRGLVAGVLSRPALPGEEIALWASGLGPTAETVPSGQILTKAYPLANLADLKVTVGGREARVTFAGVTIAGVYQANIVVPSDLPDGDHAVQAEIGGMRTQNNAFLTVARPAGTLTAIEVEFKIDARFTRGTYMGDRWVPRFGPLALDGTSLTVDVRARGVTANGQSTNISPQWIPADPQMVTVAPIEGTNEFKLTVQRAGESSLTVSAQGLFKQLTVKAAYQGGAIVVEIAQ